MTSLSHASPPDQTMLISRIPPPPSIPIGYYVSRTDEKFVVCVEAYVPSTDSVHLELLRFAYHPKQVMTSGIFLALFEPTSKYN